MKSVKKVITAAALAAFLITLLTACGSKADTGAADTQATDTQAADTQAADTQTAQTDEATDDETPYRDQGIKFMGGLVTDEDGVDMKLALYRIDGDPVVIVTDGEEIYYGDYETEDAKFDDGTEFTLIDISGKKYGYIFNDDMSGFIIDNDDNKFEAKELDEDTAMELIYETDMGYEPESDYSFVEEQSGRSDFKDYDDIISCLKPGQGYAKIKLTGDDNEVLVVTEEVFDADNSAYEGHLYNMVDGVPVYMGVVMGNGSAYPLRYEDGILYAGDNHDYESYFISPEYKGLMMKDSVMDGVNDGSNEYIGFLRETPDYDHDEDFTGGEKEFEAMIAERDKKPIIVFTKVS